MVLEIARKVNEFVLDADRLEQEQESQASEAARAARYPTTDALVSSPNSKPGG